MNTYHVTVKIAWNKKGKKKGREGKGRKIKKRWEGRLKNGRGRKGNRNALCSFTFRNFYRHIRPTLLQLFSFTAIRFNRLPSVPSSLLLLLFFLFFFSKRIVSVAERERLYKNEWSWQDLSKVWLVQLRYSKALVLLTFVDIFDILLLVICIVLVGSYE